MTNLIVKPKRTAKTTAGVIAGSIDITDDLPEGITAAKLRRYASLDQRIKRLQPAHKELNALIKAVFTNVGVFTFENLVIERTRRATTGFNVAAAESDFPYDKHPEMYEVIRVFKPDALGDRKSKYVLSGITEVLSVKVVEKKIVEHKKD